MDITQIIESTQQVHEYITTTVTLLAETTRVTPTGVTGDIHIMGAYIGAGLAMVGAAGVGAGQGYAAGSAALAVSRNPEVKPAIMSTVIVLMAIAESSSIYALIIAILLIFVAPGM